MNDIIPQDGGALLERVIVQGDLSKLSPTERVVYYKQVCDSCGLNPLMKPLEFITLNGKLVLYALRAATDQLRKLHHVSIEILKRERSEDTYLVTAKATMPDGRTDEAMGAVNLKGLSGDALANAYLKCETKAKRRVTLSICGLGMLDETEIETIPGARITPSAGVEEQLTREETMRVDEVATNMKEWITQGSLGDAVYEMENAALNAEQQIYLWKFFDSKQRSAMKKEQARMKAQAALPETGTLPALPQGTMVPIDASVIADAARKRLEARISETKIDRDTVKQYIGIAFGRAHFSELTKEEYRIVDGFVEITASATLEELAATWKLLSKDDKITLTAAKDRRKQELEKRAQEPV
jgi:hypothetical protein